MLRGFIACIIALTIAITGIVQPAYAAPGNAYTFSNQGNGNSVYINDSSQNFNTGVNDSLLNSNSDSNDYIIKTVVSTILGFTIPVGICLVADAAATTVFPPAGFLAPYCANIGAIGGAGNTVRLATQR